MLIFKYTKTGTSSLVSHLDNLRAVTYLLRRAGVRAEYSQGFNPHMELGFSPPIPLGVESLAEYVSVRTDEKENILDRLNAVCQQGITFTRQWNAVANVAALPDRAEYILQMRGIGEVIAEILEPHYAITYEDKSGVVTKEVSDRIYAARAIDADSASVILAVGNDNLRPDRVLLHLAKKYALSGDYSVTKKAAYVGEVDMDSYLDGVSDIEMC